MKAEELYEKLCTVDVGLCTYTLDKCREMLPVVNRILELKKEKNAMILAHSYVVPDILYGVADCLGDSYQLAKSAMNSDCEMIVFSAVRFMAEAAKILNPGKKVVLPNKEGGCSLADSITGEQVRELKQKYPEHTFVCYINTTAEVKAECDVCVTSSNVYKIVEKLDNDRIYFLPDKLMGYNVRTWMKEKGIQKELLVWDGSCYVHELYEPEMVDYMRVKFPGLSVAVHPECRPEVAEKADYIGSTGGLLEHVRTTDHPSYLVLTECGLSARLQAENPQKRIVGSCHFCKYMQGNSLNGILDALQGGGEEIEVPEDVAKRAKKCIDRMFELA